MDSKRFRNYIQKTRNDNFLVLEKPISEGLIKSAENALACSFPEEFLFFLREYGYAEIYGYEIYAPIKLEEGIMSSEDIVRMSLIYRDEGFIKDFEVAFLSTDMAEIFAFTTKAQNAEATGSVIRNVGDYREYYADNFFDFVEKFYETG